MKYTLLLWPHANARYQQETRKLALAELQLMLARLVPEAEAAIDEGAAMPSLALELPEPFRPEVIEALRQHSLLYGLFEARPDGSLLPVAGRAEARLGTDLPAILKYKGKTNELFLQLLINAALYSGDHWNVAGPLRFLDPMCGRATAPFIALNRGWDAVGADVDRTDLKEAEKFFKRYLEYHRFKHTLTRESRTVKGGKPVPVMRFETAATPEHFKAGQTASLSLMALDAAESAAALGRNAFHVIACDLPYGVRHDAQLEGGARLSKNWLETLTARALANFRELLKPGGAAALSFNAQTFPLEKVRSLMEAAGLEVLRGGPYDAFGHWVEQAITRDIAICRKPR